MTLVGNRVEISENNDAAENDLSCDSEDKSPSHP